MATNMTPEQNSQPQEGREKSESGGKKRFSVKFSVQGGRLLKPPTEPAPSVPEIARSKPTKTPAVVESPTQVAAPKSPVPSMPAQRIIYCGACNQLFEIAEKELTSGIKCPTCDDLLQVPFTCTKCGGTFSLCIEEFLGAQKTQVPCPQCSTSVVIE